MKPCPFCGSATAPKITSAAELNCEDEEEFNAWPHSHSYAVICNAARPGNADGCGASGGFFPTEIDACAAWDKWSVEPKINTMTIDELTAAIVDAGDELHDEHGWGLDDDDNKPTIDTLFARVLVKHIELAMDPSAAERARVARIAALRAEIDLLGRP